MLQRFLRAIKRERWTVGSTAVAAGIGVVAWRGIPELIVLSALVPTIIFRQWTRPRAFIVAFAYYAAASWPLIPGVLGYYGPTGTLEDAILFWLVASLVLPLPWVMCWPRELHSALWRLPAGYALSVVAPFGVIGWASPLIAAGIAFPGWGWFGLAALVTLGSVACVAPVRAAVVAVGLALFANAIYPGDPAPPDSWEGVHTTFEVTANAVNPLPEFQAAEDVQQIARTSPKQVIVFPEFVVPRWTEATDAFWRHTLEEVKASDKTLLIGAGLPIVGTGRYRNAVLTVGAETAPPFFERIPVPVVMWNPLNSARSVPLEMFGPGVLQVRGERAAVLVCYEQLLTWPILHSALQHPTLIVGFANDHWARGTPIAAAQRAAVTAWATLFRLPKILAVNQ
jgi:hypothetical protein